MHQAPWSLPEEHQGLLIAAVIEQIGLNAPRELFTETLFGLLEDISGFERLPSMASRHLVRYYWKQYKARSVQLTGDSQEQVPK